MTDAELIKIREWYGSHEYALTAEEECPAITVGELIDEVLRCREALRKLEKQRDDAIKVLEKIAYTDSSVWMKKE